MENEEFYSLNERLAELLDKFNDRKYSQLNTPRLNIVVTVRELLPHYHCSMALLI